MKLRQRVIQHVVTPAVLRVGQWRGDPIANLMRAQTKEDPYPFYDDIRRTEIAKSSLGGWITSSHAVANRVLRDRRFSSAPEHQKGYTPPQYAPDDPRATLPVGNLLTMDPPDHTRIRRLVSGAFSPTTVANLEPHIRDIAEALLASVRHDDRFDLIDALAFPLPIAVICYLLGVPVGDQSTFRTWGHDVAATLEPQMNSSDTDQYVGSEIALTAYLRDLVDRRRADPDDSLLSALIAVEEEGDRLTTDELVSTALLLLVAGFETTVNLIGNGTVALLEDPGTWRRLVDEPALVTPTVDELLRYDSPVQMTSRTATEDVEWDGGVVTKGSSIIVAIGGANRDPRVFTDPGRLDVDRPNASQHLSFSFGIHHCLGASLARLEGRIAIEELTKRFPTLAVAGPLVRRPLLVLRGYEQVPVRAH